MPIFSFLGYTLTELFRKPDNCRQIYKKEFGFLYIKHVSKTWRKKNIRTSKNLFLITFKKNVEAATGGVLLKKLVFKTS